MEIFGAVCRGAHLTERLLQSESIHAVDNDGLTPLHMAVLNDRADAVWSLCTAGACPVVLDNAGRTPLDCVTDNPAGAIIYRVLSTAISMQKYEKVANL